MCIRDRACAVPDNHRYCINCGGAHAANNRRCPVYSEQLDKLKKPVQPKPRHDVRQPVKPAKAAEPVVRKPAPRSAPVPKPSSAVSPSEAPKAKPTTAPPEPEREVPHYTQEMCIRDRHILISIIKFEPLQYILYNYIFLCTKTTQEFVSLVKLFTMLSLITFLRNKA